MNDVNDQNPFPRCAKCRALLVSGESEYCTRCAVRELRAQVATLAAAMARLQSDQASIALSVGYALGSVARLTDRDDARREALRLLETENQRMAATLNQLVERVRRLGPPVALTPGRFRP